jgi:hypothetical protein
MKKYKENNKIKDEEDKLIGYNSKTCNYEKFKEYIKKKNEVNVILIKKYEERFFRQYKWYSYINRKRTEERMVTDIQDKFGKDATLIIGDWSDKMRKTPSQIKYISTPNTGLKRKLADNFTVYNIDEFRTSKLNYKTEEVSGNLSLPNKKKEVREIHSILTYKTENGRQGCINRDENAVNNMIKIVESYLKDKKRPEKYTRSYKFPDPKKNTEKELQETSNPSVKESKAAGVKCVGKFINESIGRTRLNKKVDVTLKSFRK